jgi:hypothetical protein
MDLNKILTEEERGGLDPEVLAKLESAYRADLADAMKEENRKTNAKFESLMQLVGKKVDEKISKAVSTGMDKMKTDAINNKMFEALSQITGIIESVGIPATEETKNLKQQLQQTDSKLQAAYVERQNILKKLNYQAKLNRIYELTKGSSPDIVNAVIERFKNEDIRAIDKNSIADFIDNNDTGDGVTMNIDADVVNIGAVGGQQKPMDGLVDKVEMALSEIQDDIDMDMPGFLTNEAAVEEQPAVRKRKPLGEAVRRPFKPERVRIPATGSAMAEASMEQQSPDVQAAMEQMAAFQELGFGRFS